MFDTEPTNVDTSLFPEELLFLFNNPALVFELLGVTI
jgi:hypothetical protein